jgi:hypothetical protein
MVKVQVAGALLAAGAGQETPPDVVVQLSTIAFASGRAVSVTVVPAVVGYPQGLDAVVHVGPVESETVPAVPSERPLVETAICRDGAKWASIVSFDGSPVNEMVHAGTLGHLPAAGPLQCVNAPPVPA